tara:strand:+ start:41 stop:226 length:186 start_codon:yes stop_codon:yes gene_type:complete
MEGNLTPVLIGLILYFLLCGGCTSPETQEYDLQENNHLLYEHERYVFKNIKIEDILKKDNC